MLTKVKNTNYPYDSGFQFISLTSGVQDTYVFDPIVNSTSEPLMIVCQIMPVKKAGSTAQTIGASSDNKFRIGTESTATAQPYSEYYQYVWGYRPEKDFPGTDTQSMYINSTSANLLHGYIYTLTTGSTTTHSSAKHMSGVYVVAPSETVYPKYTNDSNAAMGDAYIRVYAVPYSEFFL